MENNDRITVITNINTLSFNIIIRQRCGETIDEQVLVATASLDYFPRSESKAERFRADIAGIILFQEE